MYLVISRVWGEYGLVHLQLPYDMKFDTVVGAFSSGSIIENVGRAVAPTVVETNSYL